MAKRNWYDTIGDRLPAERKNYPFSFSDLLGLDKYRSISDVLGNPALTRFDDFMSELDGVGFQDKEDHYEMVTELGGNKDIKEDAVKIELLNNDYVKITYEHNVTTEHSHYAHLETTGATLPKDADNETLSAHFDEKNRVVVTVDKKTEKKARHSRTIPIKGV